MATINHFFHISSDSVGPSYVSDTPFGCFFVSFWYKKNLESSCIFSPAIFVVESWWNKEDFEYMRKEFSNKKLFYKYLTNYWSYLPLWSDNGTNWHISIN